MNENDINKKLFRLLGYMLTSARGLVDEPKMYGPFRLIEGASRLCSMLEEADSSNSDFYSRIKEKIDREKFSVMTDEQSFINMLDEVVLDYTRKLKQG